MMNEENGNIRFLSAISYLGVLFLIGHFAVERDNPDLRFHKYQGGILCLSFLFLYMIDLLICLLFSFSPQLQAVVSFILTSAVSIAYIFMIYFGVSSALKFRQRQLPFIGFYAVRFREMMDSRRKGQ